MSGRNVSGCCNGSCRDAMARVGWSSCRVVAADTYLKRLRGMIGRKPEGCEGDAFWFPACSSVHTFFMSRPLDVVFADERGKVLMSLERVPPGRVVRCKGASFVLERFSVEDGTR